MPICFIKNCGRPAHGARLCAAHSYRLRKHGVLGGRVRQLGYGEKFIREVAAAHLGNDCLLWPFRRWNDGCGKVYFKGRYRRAPRVVCEIVHGPPPTLEHLCAHSCGRGDKGCVNPHHLSWKTPTANQADRVSHGTDNRGERHPLSTLTEDMVRRIRSLEGSATKKAIADLLGVSRECVRDVILRRRWGWLI